jgi:hypothetical protein
MAQLKMTAMNKHIGKGIARLCGLAVLGFLAGQWTLALAGEQPAAANSYYFDKTISRTVLENYLARSITVEGVFNGRGDIDDNIRMLKSVGVKYAGRSLCLWGAENNFLTNIERARLQVPKAVAADPEMGLEACVFETVSSRVEQIAVPDWVFAGHPLVFRQQSKPGGSQRLGRRGGDPGRLGSRRVENRAKIAFRSPTTMS